MVERAGRVGEQVRRTTGPATIRHLACDACDGDLVWGPSVQHEVVTAASLDDCKAKCQGCRGIEFSGSRCEVWSRSVEASIPLAGLKTNMEPQERDLSIAER